MNISRLKHVKRKINCEDSNGFMEYLSTGNILSINESPETGIPLKKLFEERVLTWIKKFENINNTRSFKTKQNI